MATSPTVNTVRATRILRRRSVLTVTNIWKQDLTNAISFFEWADKSFMAGRFGNFSITHIL